MDTQTPRQYLLANFQPTDRVAIVALERSTNRIKSRIDTAERIAGDNFQRWLRFLNKSHYEIYVSMNTVGEDARGRKKSDIAQVRHVYLDFDIDATQAVNRMMSRSDMPTPNHLIESSPGKWQAVWRVDRFEGPQAENLMRGMVREFGADPAAVDIARVLRLPGFCSHKYQEPHYITVQNLSVQVYTPADFPHFTIHEAVVESSDVAHATHSTRRHRSQVAISQSERDWAYAKRALARGENPESVIQAMAAFRTDKPDPQYYARHTVTKAAAGMERSKPGEAFSPGFGLG
jgi:hypothetical protein